MKLLLHVCCGPCLAGLLDYLKDHEVTLFFYNPNIEPKEEYLKRLESVKKVAAKFGLDLIEDDYENDLWHEAADDFREEPEGGERCKICFRMRLENAGMIAKIQGFEAFGTTLSVNAWKDVGFINSVGREISEQLGLKFYDFGLNEEEIKKICYAEKGLVKEHELYQQKYCGCLYGIQNKK